MTMHAASQTRLDPRENGPRGHSNGGFACGTFAGLVGGTAEVRLLAKVPLGVDLAVDVEGPTAKVGRHDRVLATVRATEPFVSAPPVVPTFDEAAAARLNHPFRAVTHPLSTCVVCGPRRSDGLAVTPGPLDSDADVLATPFVPTEAFAPEGQVRDEVLWGALDCPSYPAAAMRSGAFCLLGSLEAHVRRRVDVGERLVVVGWTREAGNRATRTASAMIDETGDVVASARAVWVAVRHQRVARAVARLRA
ncbi:hypothetical protein [Mumia sp. DW29H23]|uniref:hypothetical protein n=1 Tax=Mumia sp. DW29H23 TaxID=3421241 RepID=UPI003D69AD90